MFSGDNKETFKDYTSCSMKANEQKSSYEEIYCCRMVPLPVFTYFLIPV